MYGALNSDRPRPVSPAHKRFGGTPTKIKRATHNANRAQGHVAYPANRNFRKPRLQKNRQSASNLYQAISPDQSKRSVLTLSRSGSDGLGELKLPHRSGPPISTSKRSFNREDDGMDQPIQPSLPVLASKRSFHREDDGMVDRPVLPTRRCAATKRILEDAYTIIQREIYSEDDSMDPPPGRSALSMDISSEGDSSDSEHRPDHHLAQEDCGNFVFQKAPYICERRKETMVSMAEAFDTPVQTQKDEGFSSPKTYVAHTFMNEQKSHTAMQFPVFSPSAVSIGSSSGCYLSEEDSDGEQQSEHLPHDCKQHASKETSIEMTCSTSSFHIVNENNSPAKLKQCSQSIPYQVDTPSVVSMDSCSEKNDSDSEQLLDVLAEDYQPRAPRETTAGTTGNTTNIHSHRRSVSLDSETEKSILDRQLDPIQEDHHSPQDANVHCLSASFDPEIHREVRKNRKQLKRRNSPSESSFFEGNLSPMGSNYFGNRPSFQVSGKSERKLSLENKPDSRKIIDKHLRAMGNSIGQKLSLNRRGVCYFYYVELFVYVEVPGQRDDHLGNSFTMSTIIHQLIPGKDDYVNIDDIVGKVQEQARFLPKAMSITSKGKLKLSLSCTKEVTTGFPEFLECMKEFRTIALQMKEQIRSTKTRCPHPIRTVEF